MLDQFIGQTLAEKYRIDSVMRDGGGGLGKVYRATHLLMDKPVTVKVLAPALAVDESIVKRFSTEARTVSHIAHPNILNVTDFGSDKSSATYIVFEGVDGSTLRDAIIREGKMPFERAADIARQIAAALSAAHANGTIHRGLNSQNILLTHTADNHEFVKVLDFGAIAKDENDSASDAGSMRNLEYLSPEQNASVAEADERSDIYSLGVIFYEMLAGEVPYTADNATDLLLKQANNPPMPLSAFRHDLPANVEPIILRALAKNPDLRYQTIAEFTADLNNVLNDLGKTNVLNTETVSSEGNFPRRQMFGIGGSLLLFIGVFTPILSVPILGNINYFNNGKGDGVIVLVLAIISFILTFAKKYKALLLTGLGSLATMLFTFINFQLKMSEASSQMQKDGNNLFAGLGKAVLDSVQIQWGWAVLVIGAGLLIAAAVIKEDGTEEFPISSSVAKYNRELQSNMWKTGFVVLAGISLLAISLIYATSSKQNDPATALQTDANGQPVQPLNPATGMNETGAAVLTPYTPEQQMLMANSNMMLTMPQTMPNGDGFGDGKNYWSGSGPPPGAPMYQQIPPGGQMIDPNNPNSIFMQDGTVLVPVPMNTNTSVNANTAKPAAASNANVKIAPTNTTAPQPTPTTPAANSQPPAPVKTPTPTAPKPTQPPAKTSPANRTAQSGKEQDS